MGSEMYIDRIPQLGDLVEVKPDLPVLGEVLKIIVGSDGREWLDIQWPSGVISRHEASKFRTVVTSHRLRSLRRDDSSQGLQGI